MKGMLFKPELIQAIIEGRKTQTRRVIKPQPFLVGHNRWHWLPCKNVQIHWTEIYDMKAITKYARHQVGETVYVKEAWATFKALDNVPIARIKDATIFYAEDFGKDSCTGKHRSQLHLPERFARYFITITDVRAERLQEINSYDIEREGLPYKIERGDDAKENYDSEIALEWFRNTWNSINAKWKRVYNTELKIYEFWQFPWCEEDAKPIPKTTQHPERYHCVPNPWNFVYTFKQDKEKMR